MPPPSRSPAPALANALGVLLLVAGLVGLVVAAWHLAPAAGWAVLAIYSAAGGYALATTDLGETV